MKLNRAGTQWDRLERNKTNENWEIIEGSASKLEDDFENFKESVTDEVVDQLVDFSKLDWKEPVDSFADLPGNDPVGTVRQVLEPTDDGVNMMYRKYEDSWKVVQEYDATAINEVDSRLSARLATTLQDLHERGINVQQPPFPLLPVLGDGSDETDKINNIISVAHQYNIEKVIFPIGVYAVDPGSVDTSPDARSGGIELLDNIKLILHSEAIIKALPTSSGGYNIIRGLARKNIGVIGGTIAGDRVEHVGTTGEWGHGINLRGCDGITLDTKVTDCWGDGVYFGRGNNQPCTNVYIERLESVNNRRQGISLTHVDGLSANTLILTDTNGSNPQSGIDIEPNANEFVKNVFINTIETKNNAGAGVQIYAEREGALVDNVVIDKVISTGNKQGFLVRKDKVKAVTVKTLICRENVDDGTRIAEGASGIRIELLISENNSNRGLSLSGVKDISINMAKLINNAADGFQFSGGADGNYIGTLIVEGSSSTNYLIAGYSSERITIAKARLKKCKESAVYFSGITDTDVTAEISEVEKYPIRMVNSNRNNLDNTIFHGQTFGQANTYSFVRLEGASFANSFKCLTGRVVGDNKARYAFQLLNDTKDNYIALSDFKGAISQSLYSDNGTDNEFTSNRGI